MARYTELAAILTDYKVKKFSFVILCDNLVFDHTLPIAKLKNGLQTCLLYQLYL